MFFIGADPPYLLDLLVGRLPTATRHRISPFLSFFRHFHCKNLTHPPRTQIFQNSFQTFLIPCGFLLANKWPPMILTGPSFYCHRQTRFNLCILLLLIIGGVEINPSLSSSVNLTFGMLNTRSVVNKAPLLHSLIADNKLYFLALTETMTPVIKNAPAPPGYRIAHVHRENLDKTRGGGFADIHHDSINVSPRNHDTHLSNSNW